MTSPSKKAWNGEWSNLYFVGGLGCETTGPWDPLGPHGAHGASRKPSALHGPEGVGGIGGAFEFARSSVRAIADVLGHIRLKITFEES